MLMRLVTTLCVVVVDEDEDDDDDAGELAVPVEVLRLLCR